MNNRNQGGGLLLATIFDQEAELADRWIFDFHTRIENLLGIYLKPANQRKQNRHFGISPVVLNVQDCARINRADFSSFELGKAQPLAGLLYEKVAAMNKDYYDLRGKIVSAERRLAVLDERLEMWAQYEKYKPVRQKLDKVKPRKREQYQQEHRAELADFDAAADFLKRLKESGEAITPKAWRAEAAKLTAQKDFDYQKMRDMRDEIKAVENLRKTADRLAREGQRQQRETER